MSINLQKGQKISLDKEAGTSLTKIIMGLGWDVVQPEKKGIMGFLGGNKQVDVDLDASCILFDEQNNTVDAVWFRQLRSKDGSIQHTGDNRTGAGDGDDEQIIVNLTQVPATVKSLVFTVNSFTGQNFSQVANATVRLVNAANNTEVARFNLSGLGNYNAQIMAKLYRHGGEWKLHAIGETANGRTFNELLPAITPHL